MTEPLSSEQVDEIRERKTRPWDRVAVQRLIADITEISGGLSTAQEADIGQRVEEAARQLLAEQEALCDTVESLRAERDELSRLLVGGAVDVDELVASLRARQAEREEWKTLRGIAKRNADGWGLTSNRQWSRIVLADDEERSLQVETLTPAEVHAIYGTEESNDG